MSRKKSKATEVMLALSDSEFEEALLTAGSLRNYCLQTGAGRHATHERFHETFSSADRKKILEQMSRGQSARLDAVLPNGPTRPTRTKPSTTLRQRSATSKQPLQPGSTNVTTEQLIHLLINTQVFQQRPPRQEWLLRDRALLWCLMTTDSSPWTLTLDALPALGKHAETLVSDYHASIPNSSTHEKSAVFLTLPPRFNPNVRKALTERGISLVLQRMSQYATHYKPLTQTAIRQAALMDPATSTPDLLESYWHTTVTHHVQTLVSLYCPAKCQP